MLDEDNPSYGARMKDAIRYSLNQKSFPDDMMPWSETYRAYETSEMYNNLHLNLESEEEPPRRTYRKESMYLVS